MTYVAPQFQGKAFTCPHCGVYSQVLWENAFQRLTAPGHPNAHREMDIHLSHCHHCRGRMVWFVDGGPHVLYPANITTAPLPHLEMPEDVKRDYLEARDIANASPRGAAALLRLAVQKLCKHLGEPGKKIDDDIKSLVKKGLPERIQQALDIVRVTGNNAVHPGELNVEDNNEIVQSIFSLINLVVDNQIAEPKRIDELYSTLPDGARKAIERRDS